MDIFPQGAVSRVACDAPPYTDAACITLSSVPEANALLLIDCATPQSS